ncbi:MAG: hypothetical protein K6T31_06600 [Alicyclobacillus sp.]|nr:hypothetical protein [Alicyclobacillus sp.]
MASWQWAMASLAGWWLALALGLAWGMQRGLRLGQARASTELPLRWRAGVLSGGRCPVCGTDPTACYNEPARSLDREEPDRAARRDTQA